MWYITPQVTFLTELGDLPSLSTSPSFAVNSTTTGTKENAECGGNGICGELAILCVSSSIFDGTYWPFVALARSTRSWHPSFHGTLPSPPLGCADTA